jgi:chaperonin GroES
VFSPAGEGFWQLAREMMEMLRPETSARLQQRPDGPINQRPPSKRFSTMAKKKLNITPLSDRVVVRAADAEEKTSGGIIIPDTAKEKPQRGIVVAVGNGKPDEPMTVKVGDSVLYGKYAGTELSVEGADYLIMRESDIFAIL